MKLPNLIEEYLELRKEYDMLNENLYQLGEKIDEVQACVPMCKNKIVRIKDKVYIVNNDEAFFGSLLVQEAEE
jgi:uncharacterized coiled-coil DUF342 family protein